MVGPQSANSDRAWEQSSLQNRNIPAKCCAASGNVLTGWLFWYSHPPSECWFSWDQQEDVVTHCASSVQIWNLRTCRKTVPWWFHCCASELIQQIGLVSSALALVDIGCIQLYRFLSFFHLEFRVHPNIHSVFGENFMMVDHEIFNCLFLCFCLKCVSPIKSFEKFVSRFCALLRVEFSFVTEFN